MMIRMMGPDDGPHW